MHKKTYQYPLLQHLSMYVENMLHDAVAVVAKVSSTKFFRILCLIFKTICNETLQTKHKILSRDPNVKINYSLVPYTGVNRKACRDANAI